MTNLQLYLAIGIPTMAVFLGIIAGIFQTSQLSAQLNARFTSLETSMNARFSSIDARFTLVEQALKTLVCVTNDLDVRIARLEERTAR